MGNCLYILGGIFLVLNLFFPQKVFVGGVRFVFNQFFYSDWYVYRSPIYLVFYVLFYWILLFYSFFLLTFSYKNSYGVVRNQLKYFILASIVAWTGPVFMWPLEFRINIYPYSNFLIAFYPLIIAYAIIKYHLMDIHVVITRVGIFSILYVFLLFIPFYIGYQTKSWILSAICAFIFASVGPFIFNRLQKKATDLILMRQRRYQKTLLRMAEGMTRIYSPKMPLNTMIGLW